MRFAIPAGVLILLHAVSALSPRLRALRDNSEREHRRHLQEVFLHVSQTYYVPLPEKELNLYTFKEIFSGSGGKPDADQVIVSIVAISIGTENTIVWYDHYEDGYETDLKPPFATTTEIWGDGKADNGCAPSPDSIACTDESDILKAGQSIVLENDVRPYVTEVTYGFGDKISASLPVTVTRGAYPEYPGAVLAGAVEVMHTGWWGTTFESALSSATENQLDFNLEYVGVYVQAMEDATFVTFPDGSTTLLDEGEFGYSLLNSNGVSFGADKKIQAHLLTGDKKSSYELRWFALMPVEEYYNEYYSPVGDNKGGGGGVQIVAYNPHEEDITVSYEYLFKGQNNNFKIKDMNCPAKGNCWSMDIPEDSGSRFFSDKTFLAFAIIDTGTWMETQKGHREYSGMVSDWGFPLIPANFLSPEVLVGWGYGCGGLDCSGGSSKAGGKSRSVVWVTVMDDAAIYVDYDNDGNWDLRNKKTYRLKSRTYKHDKDNDMSGAVIWATAFNQGPFSSPVLLAAAWGQDPDLSDHTDRTQAMDMGTVVMPMKGLDTYKTVELVDDDPADAGTAYANVLSAGDTIRYTITVTNVGQIKFKKETVLIEDVLSEYIEYIPGSTVYRDSFDPNDEVVPDGTFPDSLFPLENGIWNRMDVQSRGGYFQISFNGVIDFRGEDPGPPIICNEGFVSGPLVQSSFEKCFTVPADGRTVEFSSPSSAPSLEPSFDPTDDPSESPSAEPTDVDEEEECPEDQVLLFL